MIGANQNDPALIELLYTHSVSAAVVPGADELFCCFVPGPGSVNTGCGGIPDAEVEVAIVGGAAGCATTRESTFIDDCKR